MKNNKKKIEKTLVKALKKVCDTLLMESTGFCWLTHFVDYSNFPDSLKIVYVFDTNQSLQNTIDKSASENIVALTRRHLETEGLSLKHTEQSVLFDTEENGADANKSGWCIKYA